jgi:hypothetical protein
MMVPLQFTALHLMEILLLNLLVMQISCLLVGAVLEELALVAAAEPVDTFTLKMLTFHQVL